MKAHAEQMSDGMELINATGTKAPDIEFLEREQAPQKTAFDPKRMSCLGQRRCVAGLEPACCKTVRLSSGGPN